MNKAFVSVLCLAVSIVVFGCSSGPSVHQEQYAKLKDNRTFENDFPTVWKGIEETFRNYKVVDRDPAKVGTVEMKNLHKRTLETDWINTQSTDKYVTFKVNGFPSKRFLWTRVKYKIVAQTVIGGVQVTVKTSEQIERLKDDGSSAGYEDVDQIDTSRPNGVLDKIGNAILSAPPVPPEET